MRGFAGARLILYFRAAEEFSGMEYFLEGSGGRSCKGASACIKIDLYEHGGYVAEMLIFGERCGFGHSFGLAVTRECGGINLMPSFTVKNETLGSVEWRLKAGAEQDCAETQILNKFWGNMRKWLDSAFR